MTLDTLEYMKRLEAAGIDRRQAEAHAEAVRDTLATQLATKADLDTAVAKLEAEIRASRAQFEMALWKHTAGTIGTVLATGGALAGIMLRFLR
jgi:predicted  nucleic acid-binding Zn-ribbon protein